MIGQDPDVGWLGILAPPDEAELERTQATTYEPIPLPRGLYDERIYAHRARPGYVMAEEPARGTRARCSVCGYLIRWIPSAILDGGRHRPGKGQRVAVAHWSH